MTLPQDSARQTRPSGLYFAPEREPDTTERRSQVFVSLSRRSTVPYGPSVLLELPPTGGVRCWFSASTAVRCTEPLAGTFLFVDVVKPESLQIEKIGDTQSFWFLRLWPEGEKMMQSHTRAVLQKQIGLFAPPANQESSLDLLQQIPGVLHRPKCPPNQISPFEIWLEFLWDFYYTDAFIAEEGYAPTLDLLAQDGFSQTLRAYTNYHVTKWHFENPNQIARRDQPWVKPIVPCSDTIAFDAILEWLAICPRRERRHLLSHPYSPFFLLSVRYDELLREALDFLQYVVVKIAEESPMNERAEVRQVKHARIQYAIFLIDAIHDWASDVHMYKSSGAASRLLVKLARLERSFGTRKDQS